MNSVDERLRYINDNVTAIYAAFELDDLSSFAKGTLAGIQQTALWIAEPDKWMDPLNCIPSITSKQIEQFKQNAETV